MTDQELRSLLDITEQAIAISFRGGYVANLMKTGTLEHTAIEKGTNIVEHLRKKVLGAVNGQ